MGTASVAAVHSLLSTIRHDGALDPEIMDYICSVVEDPDPESSLEVLVSVLSECVGAFAALTGERQAQLVLQLLDDAKPSSGTDAADEGTSTADDNSIQAVVAALRQAKLECHHEQADACRQTSRTASAAGSSSSCCSSGNGSSQEAQDLEDMGHLLALCPEGISRPFLQHCLRHTYHGDVQAAANWLLEVPPAQLRREHHAWQQEQQQRKQEQQEAELLQKRQKKLIVDKFDLSAVPDSSSSGAKKGARQASPDLLQVPKKLVPQESRLRYRDGKVVSTKGEKVIIEKVGEDWDGGSRGKVYTKGKRGKGFH